MYATGIALQAIEARRVSERHGLRLSLLTRLLRRSRWLAGLALNAAGFGLQEVALLLIPLTIVLPTLAAGLLLLLAIGRRMLREPVGRREFAAVAAIVLGVALL